MELKQRVADVAQVTLVTFSRARWGRYTIRYYNKNNISRTSCAGGATPHHPVPQARDGVVVLGSWLHLLSVEGRYEKLK